MEELKNALMQIEMPHDMKERIRKNCLSELSNEAEENHMKKRKTTKRTFFIAAVLVLCLPVIGMAVSNTGMFRDVKTIFGTVTGTEYENATEEITLSAVTEDVTLRLEATFVAPDTPPYRECEQFAIGSYLILDKTGNIVLKDKETQPEVITDGKVVFDLPFEELEKGTYTMMIDSFIGSKKADQPLPIYGNWEIKFSL